ncbi:hypothetical protein [Gloeobacter kilaueensis]|uniref:hypothetical protein n=1 Tax=Gloeobacter kilaueensis TaxID=1416614 RepID=UPI0011844A44|nr:hypothetical protein [Gloeobacter kilaueensis]
MADFFSWLPPERLPNTIGAAALVICAVQLAYFQTGKAWSKKVTVAAGLIATVALGWGLWLNPLGSAFFFGIFVLGLAALWPLHRRIFTGELNLLTLLGFPNRSKMKSEQNSTLHSTSSKSPDKLLPPREG